MKTELRQDRHIAITTAAYALIAEKGYYGMSMLAVAKRAKASNETMYRWYGDKVGLFRTMIADNAAHVRGELNRLLERSDAPLDALAVIAPKLLALLLSDRAIALNRAAAADHSGELGRALTQEGRETVGPLIAELLARAHKAGDIALPPDEAFPVFMDVLVGDQQMRRAIGALKEPKTADVRSRADVAIARFLMLVT